MAKTEIIAEPGVPVVEIVREFNAPRDLVFRAFIEPELLKQWLGPRGYKMDVDRYDVRHGGNYRYIHTDTEGNSYGFRGVFHGTPTPDLFIQTFEFEGAPGQVALESATFEDHGGRTVVRQKSVYLNQEARDMMIEHGMEKGVVQGYEQLDELLERMRVAA